MSFACTTSTTCLLAGLPRLPSTHTSAIRLSTENRGQGSLVGPAMCIHNQPVPIYYIPPHDLQRTCTSCISGTTIIKYVVQYSHNPITTWRDPMPQGESKSSSTASTLHLLSAPHSGDNVSCAVVQANSQPHGVRPELKLVTLIHCYNIKSLGTITGTY